MTPTFSSKHMAADSDQVRKKVAKLHRKENQLRTQSAKVVMMDAMSTKSGSSSSKHYGYDLDEAVKAEQRAEQSKKGYAVKAHATPRFMAPTFSAKGTHKSVLDDDLRRRVRAQHDLEHSLEHSHTFHMEHVSGKDFRAANSEHLSMARNTGAGGASMYGDGGDGATELDNSSGDEVVTEGNHDVDEGGDGVGKGVMPSEMPNHRKGLNIAEKHNNNNNKAAAAAPAAAPAAAHAPTATDKVAARMAKLKSESGGGEPTVEAAAAAAAPVDKVAARLAKMKARNSVSTDKKGNDGGDGDDGDTAPALPAWGGSDHEDCNNGGDSNNKGADVGDELLAALTSEAVAAMEEIDSIMDKTA
jgi:hypothetical protein